MTIGKRISLGFTAMILVTVGKGLVDQYSLSAIQAESTELAVNSLTGYRAIVGINDRAQTDETDMAELFDGANAAWAQALVKDIQQNAQLLKQDFADYDRSIGSDTVDAGNFSRLRTLQSAFDATFAEVLSMQQAGQTDAARGLFISRCAPLFDPYMAQIDMMTDYNDKSLHASTDHLFADVNEGLQALYWSGGAAVAIGVAWGAWIWRSLSASLGRMSSQLSSGAEQTVSAAGQVTSSSQTLARGATEQAASLQETSANLEELSAMTRQNADIAHQASALSGDAKNISDRGNAAMMRMSAAISDIGKRAGQTAQIIKTIDEIAFQTNLLALNAAVEAARAGEAGRGFAVVAEEVRNLARRSAEAAKNTSSLIDDSVQSAKSGAVIADEVAAILSEIAVSSTQVNGLITAIAAANSEQNLGIVQVTEAAQRIDKATQNNAAAAEESAAAAQELKTQGEQLQSVVMDLVELVHGANARSRLSREQIGNARRGQWPVGTERASDR